MEIIAASRKKRGSTGLDLNDQFRCVRVASLSWTNHYSQPRQGSDPLTRFIAYSSYSSVYVLREHIPPLLRPSV